MNIRCPNCQTVFRVDPSRIPAAGIRARCARCGNTFQVSRESGAAPPPQQAAKPVQPAEPVAPPRPTQPSAAQPPAAQAEVGQTPAAQPPAPQPPAADRAQPQQPAPVAQQAPAAPAPGATQATTPVTGEDDSRQEQRTSHAVGGDSAAAPRPDAGVAPARPPAGSTPSPRSDVAAPQTSAGRSGDTAPLGPATPAFRSGAAPVAAPPRPQQSRPAAPATAPVFGSRDPRARAQRIARALVSDIVAYHPKRRDECLAAGNLRTEFRDEIMKSWEEYVAQVGEEMAKGTPYFRNALNDILAKGQSLF